MGSPENFFEHRIMRERIESLRQDGYTVHHIYFDSEDDPYGAAAIPTDEYVVTLADHNRQLRAEGEVGAGSWTLEMLEASGRFIRGVSAWAVLAQASEVAASLEDEAILAIADTMAAVPIYDPLNESSINRG